MKNQQSLSDPLGILSADPKLNPDFAHFHHVVLWYCDGGSFSGDRDEPIEVDMGPGRGIKKVYFRGSRVLDAVLDFLVNDSRFDLSTAEEVLLTGKLKHE